MSTAGAVTDTTRYASPGLKDCFDEWLTSVKASIGSLAARGNDPGQIAASLGMSERAFFEVVIMMVREGSIRITGIRPNNNHSDRRKENG